MLISHPSLLSIKDYLPDEYIEDLETRIVAIQRGANAPASRDRGRATSLRPTTYTARQGQYLAFIHSYSQLHGQPPAETDIQRYFKVSAPAVHQMGVTLEQRGLIARLPGQARTIRVLLSPDGLPELV